MTNDFAGDEEDKEFGSNYDELIERLVDKEWGERHTQTDACCAECGRLIDGDQRRRWGGEDSGGEGIYEPLCEECDS